MKVLLLFCLVLKEEKKKNFDRKNNDNTASTSTKHVEQHVQLTSGTNQSHISELSVQPTFNTVNTDNTSPSELTVQPDSTYEHDKLLSFQPVVTTWTCFPYPVRYGTITSHT